MVQKTCFPAEDLAEVLKDLDKEEILEVLPGGEQLRIFCRGCITHGCTYAQCKKRCNKCKTSTN